MYCLSKKPENILAAIDTAGVDLERIFRGGRKPAQ
jgi:hypothetical protein